MAGESSPLSIIPSECFRWRPRVQFIDTFHTRKSAIDHALDHGYNLIVERNEGSTSLFDVLLDPDRACTDGINLEPLHSEEVLIEPDAVGWTSLMFLSLWGLSKRLATVIASQNCWADIHRALRSAWKRRIYWDIRNLQRRVETVATLCYSRITQQHGHVPGQSRLADVEVTFRRAWKSSSSAVISFSRQLAAEAVVLYNQEVVPFVRHAASRVWWSNSAVAFRRWWHRHSQASAADLTKLFRASLDNLYKREIAPRLRLALEHYRQQGFAGAFRRAWSISLVTFSILARRFHAALAVFYNPELVPVILQADGSLQRTDMEGAYRRSAEALAAPRHSSSSQLG
ncbi:MAG TPA: hypothetical protein VNM47_12425 [Terriglobia bacterium]|nr:hypothetical protein [Terriglobia bacterium]